MPPNVVFIISDNQSPWTLGCHGNREIRTPNVDRLAAGGARFDNAFCVNPVCSPNRATLLTGLTPSQHGVHNWLGLEKPDAQLGPDAYCTIREFANLPQILADEGYTCGLSGKWHLGDSLHPQLGFGYWFTKPRGHTARFRGEEAIWQGQVYTEPRYWMDVIAEHAVDFLRQAAGTPFFLYVGFNGPYGLDRDLREGHENRHTTYYADKPLTCFPRNPIHPWLVQNRDVMNNEAAFRNYACAVSGVDDGVGVILDSLDELGLAADTLVVYTADHGLCAGHHGVWGMGDHSRPLHVFQENLRVPLIFRHPAGIAAGQVRETMTCHYDFFPSVLSYLGLEGRMPRNVALPGRDYAGALRGEESAWGEEIVFHEYENTRAAQTPEWKLVLRRPDGPNELYDMRKDAGEYVNLFHDPAGADARGALTARLEAFFARYVDAQYDMWRGGRTKAGRILNP